MHSLAVPKCCQATNLSRVTRLSLNSNDFVSFISVMARQLQNDILISDPIGYSLLKYSLLLLPIHRWIWSQQSYILGPPSPPHQHHTFSRIIFCVSICILLSPIVLYVMTMVIIKIIWIAFYRFTVIVFKALFHVSFLTVSWGNMSSDYYLSPFLR